MSARSNASAMPPIGGGYRGAGGRGRRVIRLAALAALLALQTDALQSDPVGKSAGGGVSLDASRVSWSRLSLRASKFTISVESQVELSAIPRARAARDLLTPGQGEGVVGSSPETLLVRIASRLMGRETNTRLWFDPAGARALQRIQHETGKRNRYKVNRFTGNGVFTLRRNPNEGEEKLPQEQWTKVRENFTPYPVADTANLVVIEPSALFYFVSAADLSRPGQKMLLHVFSKDHLNLLEMTVEGRTRLKVDYVEVAAGRERRIKTDAEALHISLLPRPVAGDPDQLDFQLLGLEGDLDLFLDPEHRVPLELSGRIKYVGKVRVRLQRVELE